jgi:hypothetical protein
MNKVTNPVEAFAKPKLNASETYVFAAFHWICAKCLHHIVEWHDANETTGLMSHQDCGGSYLPSDFYYLAMGDSAGRPTAASDHGLHGMHDDWLA